MAENEFLRLDSESTPFHPVAVSSKSKGSDVLADVFGEVSHVATKAAVSIAEEQSTSQLLTANTAASKIATQAKMSMMEDSTTDNLKRVMGDWVKQSDSIKSNTKLNGGDRRKLDAYLNTQTNELALHGTKLAVETDKKAVRLNYFDNFSANLEQVTKLVNKGQFTQAESLAGSMMQEAKNMHDLGGITGETFLHHQRLTKAILEQSIGLHKNLSNPNLDAKDYHDQSYSWPNSHADQSSLAQAPVDQNTAHIKTVHLNDQSYRNQYATAVKDRALDPEALLKLPQHQIDSIVFAKRGADSAEHYLQANSSWTSLVAEFNRLKTQPRDTLNSFEQGKLSRLEYIVKNFTNGYYPQMMNGTVLGAQASQDFQQTASAIEQNYKSNDPRFEQANAKNLNQYTSSMASIGISAHLPSEFIQPFHEQFLAPVKESLSVGGDPSKAVTAMHVLNPENKAYLVNSMPTSRDQEVMRVVAGKSDYTPPGFLKDMVQFNQKGLSFNDLKVDGVKDTKIRAKIETSLADYLDFQFANGNATTMGNTPISTIGGPAILKNGQNRRAAATESFMNYVKGKAIEHGDFELNHVDDYISDLKKNMTTTYDLKSGYNYQINNKNLGHDLSKEEADAVASWAIVHALDRVKAGRSEADYYARLDKNPLFMTIDQYNNIVVMDQKSRSILYHIPYSSGFLTEALHANKKIRQDALKGQKEKLEQHATFQGTGY